MTHHILTASDGPIFTITFNRPERRNALTHEMYDAIADAMIAAEANTSVRAIVFRGSDGCFSAGNDMIDFLDRPPHLFCTPGTPPPVERVIQALHDAKKPLIAVVDGYAIGLGTTMLFHCDLVYASERSVFGTPFTALSVTPECGSSFLIPRMMGYPQAAELLMLSDRVSADDALRMGFVTRVFPADTLKAEADKKIQKLVSLPPQAVLTAKALMRRAPESLQKRMQIEGEYFTARLDMPEFKEAANAFLEKRSPDFSNF